MFTYKNFIINLQNSIYNRKFKQSTTGALRFCGVMLILLFLSASAYAQKTWDGGAATNSWADGNNWNPNGIPTTGQEVVFSGQILNIINVPNITLSKLRITNNSNITLRPNTGGNRTITVNSATNDAIVVDASSTLIISGNNTNSRTLTLTTTSTTNLIANISGTLRVTIDNNNQSAFGVFTKGANATIQFNSGSTYDHNRNGGAIPTASWNSNSTCLISGITTTIPTVTTFNQAFGHFTWNNNQSADLTISSTGMSIAGDLSVVNTGGTNTLAIAQNLNIGGNLNISSGARLNLGNYTHNRTTAGGTLTVAGTMLLGGNTGGQTGSNFPLNFSTINLAGGTVDYTYAGNQTIFASTYNNLTLSGTGTKTASNNFTVNGNISIPNSGTTLDSYIYQITGNSSGSFTLGAGANLVLGRTTGAYNDINFPTNYTNVSLSPTSTVEFLSAAYQTIPAYNYGNLTIASTSGSNKVAANSFAVAGNFTINSNTNFQLGYSLTTLPIGGNLVINGSLEFNIWNGHTVTVTGNLSGTGAISMTTGNQHVLNLNGANNSIGSLTSGATSTVNYGGAGSQQIFASTNYANLTISGGGAKTLSGTTSVSNVLTLTSGIVTTSGNTLTLTNTSASAITGGSSSSYINGSLTRALPSGLASGTSYAFPIGTGTGYYPLTLVNPTTSGAVNVTGSAFAGNAGGSINATLLSKSSTEYWSIATSNSSLTNTAISVERPTVISPYDGLAGSTTQTGTYTTLGGTSSTYGVSTSNAVNTNRFFVLAQIAPTLTLGAIIGSTFCAGSTVSVPYTSTGTFTSGNIFTAQLSNATGSFASPTNIGTLTSVTSGIISATLPFGASTGTGYRIRVVSSTPALTTADNGSNITINATSGTPTTTNVQLCIGSPDGTTLIASGAVSGEVYKWYSAASGGTLLKTSTNNTDNTYTTPTLSSTTNYWVSIQNASGCESSRAQITATMPSAYGGSQLLAGTNSWIGHVYDDINFDTYYGTSLENETFDESFLGSATCFPFNAGNASRSMYTTTFSVRYRMNSTKRGLYTVNLGSDDGTRLFVDGNLIYNNWSYQAFSDKNNVLLPLTGSSSLIYEFFENGGENRVIFQNLTKLIENTLTTNTSQTVTLGSSGTAISGDVFATLPANITLSGTGYQWTYSTTPGGARTNINGATSATFTPNTSVAPFNAAGTYYIYRNTILSSTNNVNPSPYVSTLESNAATLTVLPVYCTSTGSNTYGITAVTINTINNTGQSANPTYTNYTNLSTNLIAGLTYNLTITLNTGGNTFYARAWFDWNGDGDFNDAGEAYSLGTRNSTAALNYSIAVPVTAKFGQTRMRISSRFNAYPGPCDTGFTGEVEDYTVIVTPPALNTGNILGSPFSLGASVSVPFTVNGAFVSGNVFTAQLSDANGSFTSPTNIGTLTGTGSGTISATIPMSAISGTGYRIRVVSSNQAIIGNDNGTNLSIFTNTIGLSTYNLNNFNYIYDLGPSTEQTFVVSGTNLIDYMQITAGSTYEISQSSGTGFQSTINLYPTSGNISNTTIYVRLKEGLTVGTKNSSISITSGTDNRTISLTGLVLSSTTFSATGDYNCNTDQVILNSTSTNVSNIYWTGPNSFYSNQANTTFTTTNTAYSGTYTAYGSVLSGVNLVTNGSFENGNTGFSSSYTYRDSTYINPADLPGQGTRYYGSLFNETDYTIATNPNNLHINFSNCSPKLGNKQLVINGAGTANVSIWSQTVECSPNTDYQFTYWLQSVNGTAPSQLQLYANGIAVGPIYTAQSTTCVNTQYFYNWNSESATTVTLTLINQNTATGGNDFAIDDIIFQSVLQVSAPVNISISNPTPAVTIVSNDPDNSVPAGTNVTYTATPTNGGTAPGYQWKVNGVNVGTNSATYSYVPNDGDVVTCVITSNSTCANGQTATSNEINMTVTNRANYWLGGISSDWFNANNWTDHIPLTGEDVVFASTASGYTTNAINDLQLDVNRIIGKLINKATNGKKLIIPANKLLTVNDSIISYNNNPNLIQIEASSNLANGSMIFSYQGPVYANVQMYSRASWDLLQPVNEKYKWQFFGIPVKTLNALPTFYGAYVRQMLEHKDKISNHWEPLTNSSVLVPFKGYELCQESPQMYTFTGQLTNSNFNTGQLVKTLTGNPLYPGQHLLANSYTAAINIKDIVFGNDMEKTVYIYNTGTYNSWDSQAPTNDSLSFMTGQYIAAPQSVSGLSGIARQIPSMGAFLVRITSTASTAQCFVGLNYSSVVKRNIEIQRAKHNTSENSDQSEENSDTPSSSTLNVAGKYGSDKLWLLTHKKFSTDFDNGYDGFKMERNALNPILYAVSNGVNYQINSVPELDNVTLMFKAGQDTDYTLKIEHDETTLAKYSRIYLHDLFENVVIDISNKVNEYNFSAGSTPEAQVRFKILASKINEDTQSANLTTVYNNDGKLYIQNLSDKAGRIYLYDITGRTLLTRSLDAFENINVDIKDMQTYIVKRVIGATTETTKILVE